MDPNSIKCYFFRGKSLLEVQEYDKAVECFKKILLIDPNHGEGKNELARAIKIRNDYREKQTKAFSKMFS